MELMIMNLEITLEEMRRQAEEKGIQAGKLEGKLKGGEKNIFGYDGIPWQRCSPPGPEWPWAQGW